MKCDVLIVGAATTGFYLGWILAKKGHSVIVIDKEARDQVGQRLEIIHLHREAMKELGIFPPTKPPEYLFPHAEIIVSRLPLFLQRQYDIIEKDGVQLEFTCEFKELLYEKGKINGARLEKNGKSFEIEARLVVDASGIPSVVRTSLPDDYGVETWKFGKNRFFVILHYIKWLKPEEPHPKWGDVKPYYYLAFDPGYTKDEAIMLIAGPESFKKSELLVKECLAKAKFPPFELKKREFGWFPYSRPPYSLVGDGFLCVGDSASIAQYVTTRCIPETWRLSTDAANVIDKVLKSGNYLSREALWDINVNHFRNEGADLIFLLMISSGIYKFTEAELDFLLVKLKPMFDPPEDALEEMDFTLEPSKIIKAALLIISAIVRGVVSMRRLVVLLQTLLYSNRIKGHYKKFPKDPKDFDAWVKKADKLWKLREPPKRKFLTTTAQYP